MPALQAPVVQLLTIILMGPPTTTIKFKHHTRESVERELRQMHHNGYKDSHCLSGGFWYNGKDRLGDYIHITEKECCGGRGARSELLLWMAFQNQATAVFNAASEPLDQTKVLFIII